MELLITRQAEKDATTLVLTGSVDLVSRRELIDAGMTELQAGNAIALDMSGVDFIDSTGIGALVELQVTARNAALDMTISRRSERVERILEVTGLATNWATT